MNLNVRVNPGPLRDEVFITSNEKDENYVNRTIYAKPGLFANSELSAQQIEDLEKQSISELAEERIQKEKVELAAALKAATTPPTEPRKGTPDKTQQKEEE